MTMSSASVVFTPSGKRGSFPHGTRVLQAARSLGVDLDSVCGGRGICARCQVIHTTGEFPKHGLVSAASHLSPFDATEEKLVRKTTRLKSGRRLGCTAQILGDCVIDVPPESQIHRQVVRKEAEIREIKIDPVVRLYYVEVEPPKMEDPTSDIRRLLKALETEWELQNIKVPHSILEMLQPTLREGKWKVTVAVDHDGIMRGIWSDFREHLYGIAVDIGSTTLAAHLCELGSGEVLSSAGMMNPQIRFGEDLMSRVSYVMLNQDGEKELTKSVREALNQLSLEVCEQAGIQKEEVMEMVMVGNPVMHHLVHGINPVELGGAPFALATDEAIITPASELDLQLHQLARTYTLPCIAGHVGADTAAMVLAEAPHHQEAITLLVDVGTNAEIVLGNRDRLLAASSPTGPAFEGAQISSGQRAAPGAVERVRIDPKTLEPRFRVIGSECWSDDVSFAEETKKTGVTGICGSGIIEAIAELYLCGIISQDGLFDESMMGRSNRIIKEGRTCSYLLHTGEPELRITQNDIRAIQLAKAALYAGIRLLMDHLGIEEVQRIRLAGAFGSHIDVKYAMILGLIPDCDLDHVSSAGNAAGTGARMALLNHGSRREIEETVRKIEKVETAVEPAFQQHFVDAMAIPHKHAPSTHLQKTVSLPEAKNNAQGNGDSTSRRRRSKRVVA